jgi:hypothetical protein
MDSEQEKLKKEYYELKLNCIQLIRDIAKIRKKYTLSLKDEEEYKKYLFNCVNESDKLRNIYISKYGIDLFYTKLDDTSIPKNSTNAVGGSNYKSKYLKYKNKYLELKNKMTTN